MNIGAYILILFVHVGPMGNGNSNAITTAEFGNEKACALAGQAAKRLAQGTVKHIEFACIPKTL